MWRGLYTAATGMVAENYRTDNIANNLANSNTTGYKRDDAVIKEFRPLLLHRIDDKSSEADSVTTFKGFSINNPAPVVGQLGMGAELDEVVTDFSQGAFQTTGNPLDVAIAGDGFFEVQTPQGVRYTRDGNFYRSANGTLVTVNNQPVLDSRGRTITIPDDAVNISIGPDGNISTATNGRFARLAFVQFANPRQDIEKQGDNLYIAVNGAQPTAATGSIQQGMLERANTNTVSEMVNLIANYRAYEANSKAVVAQDELLDKAVNEVGKGS